MTDAELRGIEMRLALECPAHLRLDLDELLAEVRRLRREVGYGLLEVQER